MRLIDAALLDALHAAARRAPRLRAHRNWHDPARDRVQRFFVHLLPGSYVRPHCHAIDGRCETVVLLEGAVDLLHFAADGTLRGRVALRAGGIRGAEIGAEDWHSLHVSEPATLLEIKEGPYDPATDKRFAEWAPPEGDPRVPALLSWFATALPGQRWPGTQKA